MVLTLVWESAQGDDLRLPADLIRLGSKQIISHELAIPAGFVRSKTPPPPNAPSTRSFPRTYHFT